jgi:FtsH-binding integral membrane protein
MAFEPGNRFSARGGAIPQVDIDVGLRQHMLRVYNYMVLGLAITGLVAYFAMTSGFYASIVGTPLVWVVMLAPLAFVMVLSYGIQRLSLGTAQLLFWVFSAVMGLSLSWIFLRYTGTSVARVFFITSGTFAGMSLYGYTTKRDLTSMGSFMFMGLIGVLIASIVNIFMQSSALYFAISVIGVIVFVGLTAWDTQRIKESYSAGDGDVVAGKKAIWGALALYLDFINLFVMLLRLFGDRR